MRKLTLIIISMALALTCAAREYTRDAAMKAAATFLPKGVEAEFLLIEMKDGNGDGEPLVGMFRSAKQSKAVIALVSPKLKYIKANLADFVRIANGERFDGVQLIVVGEKIDPKMFTPIVKATGLEFKFAAY